MHKSTVSYSIDVIDLHGNLCAAMGQCSSSEKSPPLYPMDIGEGLRVFEEIAPGFYRCAVPFRLAKGLVDTFTHMGLVRLSSGKFVALATVDPTGAAKTDQGGDTELGLIKQDIDVLTDNGRNLEAVIATHSFHTLAYTPFYECYPSAQYYGCPRHLLKLPQIPWAGVVTDCKVQNLYSPQIEIRIPPVEAAEFDSPEPPDSNHFNSVIVKAHGVLFNDDMIQYTVHPKELMGRIVVWVTGATRDHLSFHMSMFKGGLRRTAQSPDLFLEWIEALLAEWDFDIIASAHNAVLKAGAKQRLQDLVEETRPKLKYHAEKWEQDDLADLSLTPQEQRGAWSDVADGGHECG